MTFVLLFYSKDADETNLFTPSQLFNHEYEHKLCNH